MISLQGEESHLHGGRGVLEPNAWEVELLTHEDTRADQVGESGDERKHCKGGGLGLPMMHDASLIPEHSAVLNSALST